MGFDELNNENFKKYKESLKCFWIPFQIEEAEEGILICNYIIRSMPSTGRCVFLNPINKTCFIYPVRPATCRLYPFSIKIDEENIYKIIVALEDCPGIGMGNPINKEEIRETIQKFLDEMQIDITVYKKYIQDKSIKRIGRKGRKEIKDVDEALEEFERSWFEQYYLGKKSDVKYGEKMLIEPFAELGLIPPHPLIIAYNNVIKTKNFEKK
ncbi:MAG: YkgJ family cysteine cluster protein [archaeon GB-1867-035]|nr:YkgJ family cysteine cluster protein [Candidatus Culexmicrobium profundum]